MYPHFPLSLHFRSPVNKNLKDVQKYTFASLVSYDHSQTFVSDSSKILDELGGALWREVYRHNEKLSVDHVMRLAKYVVREMDMIQGLEADVFIMGRIPWGDAPEWDDVIGENGEIVTYSEELMKEESEKDTKKILEDGGVVVEDDADLPGRWKTALTEGGKVYYWNEETRKSSWERPTE